MKTRVFKDVKQYAITSTLKKEDIELLKKYNPSALRETDENGNDVFAISYCENRPCIGVKSVTFGGVNGEGYLTITGPIPEEKMAKAGEYIADLIGGVVPKIEQFERTVPEAAAAVKATRETIIGNIEEV